MAIKDVESKCWILALFVRDDGERFLLGDGSYEFTEKQLHFAANTMANDVVEVQGNDGYLLAGQVRRPSTQTFDGYVGDSSTSKALVEERRRAFFAFFRKNFFYKVIYIFPDGSAIQRKRGFLVDAPEVKEIRQIYPEYHVALNFEDINYYYYDEDADGQEIYGKSATINLNSVAQSGGLIWLLPSEMTLTGEGTSFTLSGTVNGTALTSAELKGDTEQQTYSGKNKFIAPASATSTFRVDYTKIDDNSFQITRNTTAGATGYARIDLTDLQPSTEYTLSYDFEITQGTAVSTAGGVAIQPTGGSISSLTVGLATFTTGSDGGVRLHFYTEQDQSAGSPTRTIKIYNVQIELGDSKTTFEPYVGGIPAPNPDYPQTINTVTGRQVVTISNGTESQEYEINLGKNLFDKNNINILHAYFDTSGGSIISNAYNRVFYVSCEPNTAYSFTQGATSAPNHLFQVATTSELPEVGVTVSNFFDAGRSGPVNYLTNSSAKYLVVRIRIEDDVSAFWDGVQIEKGSAATPYAPYFEPIELCKIGDYQDYIYKSGDDWYVHKDTKKITFNGTESWTMTSANNSGRRFFTVVNDIKTGNQGQFNTVGYSDYFIRAAGDTWSYYGISGSTGAAIYVRSYSFDSLDASGVTTWFSSHPANVYYVLATPTDTQITNTALIAQLNALATATTYNGSTNFTVDGNGNLAAILAVEVEAVGGGGVEWDEDGAVWEEGKPSYSIISVDSIDNVYPVLTITGRTVNPVLTDVTTGTIFQYNGTITESQVLRVDMMNKTATLNGVSVIGNVTGDWLYLAPSNNRVTYTADNADAPNATVEWQEIVG